MKRATAMAIAMLAMPAAFAAAPTDPPDAYDYDAHATTMGNPTPAGHQGKFDPYTEGANTSTATRLADETTSAPAPGKPGKSHHKSSKKAPASLAAPTATE